MKWAVSAGFCAALVFSVPLPVAGQAWEQAAAHVPRFEQCLPEQMAAFEAGIAALPGYGASDGVQVMNAHWVQHCGYLAAGICNASEEAFLCLRRLRAGFRAQTEALRTALPVPDTGGARGRHYAQVYALAFDTSAGDDCAGQSAHWTMWCSTFHASLSFERVVAAWQVARLTGRMGPQDWDARAGLE